MPEPVTIDLTSDDKKPRKSANKRLIGADLCMASSGTIGHTNTQINTALPTFSVAPGSICVLVRACVCVCVLCACAELDESGDVVKDIVKREKHR
jgi:hypothetical protein